jgi:hypothetical protein
VENPRDLVEREAIRLYSEASFLDIQPLAPGVYSVLIYADDGPDGETQAIAQATYQVKAVLAGEPVKLSVAEGAR